ncbi:MAG: glutaredoxin family protein [Thermoanaerobaculia bacterium]
MIPVVVYSRAACHLCDVAKHVIETTAVAEDLKIELRVIDIDGVPDLRELYTDEVPVVTIAGKKAFKYRVDPAEFARRVRRAEAKEKR